MFEPDGRNDIQYIGHLLLSAWRIYCMILGFIIVLPWIWVYWNRLTIKAQQGDLRIWERMPRVADRRADRGRGRVDEQDQRQGRREHPGGRSWDLDLPGGADDPGPAGAWRQLLLVQPARRRRGHH